MYKSDLIYMATTTSSAVESNEKIPLTTTVRRRGCAIYANADNTISLNKSGYYTIKGTVTFTGQEIGTATIALQKGDTPVEGGRSSVTIGTASTITYTLPVNATVRVFCGENAVTISLINSGAAITTSNISLSVEYEG